MATISNSSDRPISLIKLMRNYSPCSRSLRVSNTPILISRNETGMWIFERYRHPLHSSRYLEKQVENLEMEVEQARHATKTTPNPELLRYSKGIQKALQTQVSALEAENSKLRFTNSQLEDQLSQEQIKRETLQNREWQSQNSERSHSKTEDS